MKSRIIVFLLAMSAAVRCAAAQDISPATQPAAPGRAVVVWISIDGLRHDFVEREKAPFLLRTKHEGAFTEQLVPVFPSVTFPSHASEATGVLPSEHGIVANSFYDTATKKRYDMPDDPALLQAEPIWITAPRQHVRAAVFDWPFSYRQPGPIRADYFNEKLDQNLTDAQRLDHLIEVWRADDSTNRPPLQLIMGYLPTVDHAGHVAGPDSAAVRKAVLSVDHDLDEFAKKCVELFNSKMRPEDELYLLFTTDHGMSKVTTTVNVTKLLSADLDAHIVARASVAHIYLDTVPEADRAAKAAAILEHLKQYPFVRAWAKSDLPAEFSYAHLTRAGDIVVSLAKGYDFSGGKTDPTTRAVDPRTSRGMHGYNAADNDEMLGFAAIWRYRHPLGGKDLGRVHTLQLHPTVAKLLGIAPAPGASGEPLKLEK